MNKFEQVRALIKVFWELFPDAEWSYAHTVLSDYNLEDNFVLSAIKTYEHIPDQTPSQTATYRLLQLLLIIPEEERCAPEDEDADDEDEIL